MAENKPFKTSLSRKCDIEVSDINLDGKMTDATEVCDSSDQILSILRNKCREYCLKEEKKELSTMIERQTEAYRRRKKDKKKKIEFDTVMIVKFIPKRQATANYTPVDRLDTMYLMTGQNIADLPVKFEKENNVSMLFSRDSAEEHWRTSGMRLAFREYIDGILNNERLLRNVRGKEEKPFYERRQAKLQADIAGLTTLARNTAVCLGFTNFPQLQTNVNYDNALPKYSEGIERVIIELFRQAKLSSSDGSSDTEKENTGNVKQPKKVKPPIVTEAIITPPPMTETITNLVKFISKLLVLEELLFLMKNAFLKKKVFKMLGSRVILSCSNDFEFRQRMAAVASVQNCFDRIVSYVKECDDLLGEHRDLFMTLNSLNLNAEKRNAKFAKILIDLGDNKYQDMFSGSILAKHNEDYYRIVTLKGFKKEENAIKPKLDQLYSGPEILSKDFEKLTFILKNGYNYWKLFKQNFLEVYMKYRNSGVIIGVVNDNMRLLKYYEKLPLPEYIKKMSMEVEYKTIKMRNQAYRIQHLFKGFKKRFMKAKLPIALHLYSIQFNPIVRADLQYSYSERNCPIQCKGHRNMLLGLALKLGHIKMAKYLISRGLNLNAPVCSHSETIALSWENQVRVPRKTVKIRVTVKKEEKVRDSVTLTNNADKKRELRQREEARRYNEISNDTSGILSNEQIRLQSVNKQKPALAMALDYFLSYQYLKQRKFNEAESRAMRASLNAQYKFIVKAIKLKKRKMLSYDAYLLRLCVFFLRSFTKALRKQQIEKSLDAAFMAECEQKAIFSLKESLKTTDYKRQVDATLALLNIRLYNLIMRRAKKEVGKRKLSTITLFLVDECIQQDQFSIISCLTEKEIDYRKAIKWLVKQIKPNNSTNRRLLKGIVVLRDMFELTLSKSCLNRFVDYSVFMKLGFADVNTKAGELKYLKEIFQVTEVKQALLSAKHEPRSKALLLMASEAINPALVTDLLSTFDELQQHMLIEQLVRRVIVFKSDLPDPETMPLFRKRSLINLFSLMLDEKSFTSELFPSLLYLLNLEPSCVKGLKPDQVARLYTGLLTTKEGVTLGVERHCDLTAFKLYALFTRRVFDLNKPDLLIATLDILQKSEDSYEPFMFLDFVNRLKDVIDTLDASLADNESLIAKKVKKHCIRLNRTLRWKDGGDMIYQKRLKKPLKADMFAKAGLPTTLI